MRYCHWFKKLSYRRYLLKCLLDQNLDLCSGIVVDLGGEKNREMRYLDRSKTLSVKKWIFLNLDTKCDPDIYADAGRIPLKDSSVNTVICTEVFEHLSDPWMCRDEVFRILKPGGVFLGSVPFLFPFHETPRDYTRFTSQGISYLFRNFVDVSVFVMGGYLGTIGVIAEYGVMTARLPQIVKKILCYACKILCFLDEYNGHRGSGFVTTGYFWIAKKPVEETK